MITCSTKTAIQIHLQSDFKHTLESVMIQHKIMPTVASHDFHQENVISLESGLKIA